MTKRFRFAVVATAFAITASSLFAEERVGRAISRAEQAAVEAVADFLVRGPRALHERLDEAAPLAKVDRKIALEEIEARVGPPQGSRWRLLTGDRDKPNRATFAVQFPSTVDDAIVLEMKEVRDGWKIASIRTLAERDPSVSLDPKRTKEASVSSLDGEEREQEAEAEPKPKPVAPVEARKRFIDHHFNRRLAVLFILLATGASAAGAWFRWRRRSLSVLLLSSSLLLFALHAVTVVRPRLWSSLEEKLTRRKAEPEKAVGGVIELRALLPLRRAMSRGLPSSIDPAELPDDVAIVARLWLAEAAMARDKHADAAQLLASIGETKAPLLPLLRARNAIESGDERAAVEHYDEALNAGSSRDGLLFEALVAVAPIDEKQATHYLNDLVWMGTREAAVYYIDALRWLGEDEIEDAMRAFRRAWIALPMSRSQLISAGVLSVFLTDAGNELLVDLNSPEELTISVGPPVSVPAKLPKEVQSFVCGLLLRINYNDRLLDVPGGASIAPPEAVPVTALHLQKKEAEAALATVRTLAGVDPAGSPLVRAQLEKAVEALAAENRWDEVLQLTETAVRGDVVRDPVMTAPRVKALLKKGRGDEARTLARAAAKHPLMRSRNDWRTLWLLSELMAAEGEFDLALELIRAAIPLRKAPSFDAKVEQLGLRAKLASQGEVSSTEHFILRATQDVPLAVVERIGQILEAEMARLNARIPFVYTAPINVNVTAWSEFSQKITGTEHVLAIYDGEITYPFAKVNRFTPETVSVLTHELTHAMLARASNDNAPAWMHEGLATRLEFLPQQMNVFTQRRPEDLRAIELLDATIGNGIDPLSAREAYDVANAFIRYLESEHGEGIVALLIHQFASGKTTDQALRSTTGKGLAEHDRAFRQWGERNRASFTDSTPWPYGSLYSLGIDPRIRQGIRLSREKKE